MEEDRKVNSEEPDVSGKLVSIRRISKTVAGGRRFKFSALVTAGDRNGNVGVGLGKAKEIPRAIQKAEATAKKNLIHVSITGNTIPHEIIAKFGAAKVLLKPAAPGTGIIAGGTVRAVVEAAGINDILTKSLGSSSSINIAQATLKALSELKDSEKEWAKRGIEPRNIFGRRNQVD